MHSRYAVTTAIAAVLTLTLAGCADDDEAPTRAADNATTESETPAEEATDETTEEVTEEEEQDTNAVPTDLALGDTHNWNDGISLAVTGVTEVPASELGEFDAEFLPEGETPVELAITVTNAGEAPLDLSEFAFFIEGATTGGEATPQFFEGDEFLEGRLAPGESRDHAQHYSFNTSEYGTDVTVEGLRMYDGMDFDSPIWAVAIS